MTSLAQILPYTYVGGVGGRGGREGKKVDLISTISEFSVSGTLIGLLTAFHLGLQDYGKRTLRLTLGHFLLEL